MTAGDLRKRRTQLGLTQAGLAARLKVAPNTVARWEREVLALPPFLNLALETVEAQLIEERRRRGPGRPPKRTRARHPPEGAEEGGS